MLNVTDSAKEHLTTLKESKTPDPQVAVRITRTKEAQDSLGMTLDVEREGDAVIQNESGNKILVLNSELAASLQGYVLDFQETPQGSSFTLSATGQ
jgi:Fe-S cluster assembly iron-binding protein IscA